MIIGIGSDLVDVRRVEKALERFGGRFERRIFTQGEIDKASSRKKTKAATLAKRFAAKEACAKALGTGFGPINWTEIEVVNIRHGKPALNLTGKAAQLLERLVAKGQRPRVHLTLSDAFPYAQAFVVIEEVRPTE